MEREEVQEWLDRYIEAWRRNEKELIAALFSDNAVYHFAPWGAEHTATGVEEIVAAWMDDQDEPDSWEAHYTVFTVDGDRAVATGTSEYFESETRAAEVFHNCYLMRFA
ncbi:MAG: hypothetical protein GEU79_17975, partial [Acidimicrobiia bacterium]|nr:hypothetical protein [Acidimicrobiia bacterium]